MKKIKFGYRKTTLATLLMISGSFAHASAGNIGKPPPLATTPDVAMSIGNGIGKPPPNQPK